MIQVNPLGVTAAVQVSPLGVTVVQDSLLWVTVVQVNHLVVTVVLAQPMCQPPVQSTLDMVLGLQVLVQSTLHMEHPAQHTQVMEVDRLLQLNLVLEDQILTSEVDPVQPCPVKVIPWEGQVLLIPVLEDLAQHIPAWEDLVLHILELEDQEVRFR